eukprot:TRINITY_DN5951_c0_g1_i1.p1 TRINITY_DN5951_c0_g1~~TRINITY_DN5951_c0_g1_i1.p1  ORF type:complete len:294 (-),score=45.47 TRINITY_DN5951_c0_g1_i1:102-983(-)
MNNTTDFILDSKSSSANPVPNKMLQLENIHTTSFAGPDYSLKAIKSNVQQPICLPSITQILPPDLCFSYLPSPQENAKPSNRVDLACNVNTQQPHTFTKKRKRTTVKNVDIGSSPSKQAKHQDCAINEVNIDQINHVNEIKSEANNYTNKSSDQFLPCKKRKRNELSAEISAPLPTVAKPRISSPSPIINTQQGRINDSKNNVTQETINILKKNINNCPPEKLDSSHNIPTLLDSSPAFFSSSSFSSFSPMPTSESSFSSMLRAVYLNEQFTQSTHTTATMLFDLYKSHENKD